MTGTATPLIHYHAPNTRSLTILWLFEELGNPAHETRLLDLAKAEHKTPDFLRINPMGKVPTIVYGRTPVTETPAIAIFLADLFRAANLAPALDDEARGTYLRWMIFSTAAVEPAVMDVAFKREPAKPSAIGYGTFDNTVDALSAALAAGPFVLGERFSAADVVIGSTVRYLTMFKLLPPRPEFLAYIERLAARPPLQRALERDKEYAAELAT